MWGSPEELETVAMHFAHALWLSRDPGWTFEQTFEKWRALGGLFAGDADEHATMRARMWGESIAQSRVQVQQGYLVVWTSLDRVPAREALLASHIEGLIDFPERVSTPDRLNMVLFALMGFVAADAPKFVQALSLERHRVGGHELRPLQVVAPPGPSDAALTYTRNFTTWPQVIGGIERFLESPLP